MSSQLLPSRIAVDANFLVAYVNDATPAQDRERIDWLLSRAEKAKSQIIIPMPALAEFLVRAELVGVELMNLLERKAYVIAAPFDRAAAFECALLDRAAVGAGDKRDGVQAPWQKVKIDRQVVAIAKARGAQLIISADTGVRGNAMRIGMQALTVGELDLPDSSKQIKLELVPRSVADGAVGETKRPGAARPRRGHTGDSPT